MAGFAQASPLASAAAALGVPVNLPISSTTPVLSVPVTAGTWLVTVNLDVQYLGAQLAVFECQATQGTATAALSGITADGAELGNVAGGAEQAPLNLSLVAVVTVAGNLSVTVKNPNGVTVGTCLASSGSYAGSSGYTALKIA